MLGDEQLLHFSAVVLLTIALCVAIAAWRLWRTTRYHLVEGLLYAFSYAMTRVLWRTKIVGHLPILDHEGAVIVANHTGPIDPSFIGLLTRRSVHWMVAKEFFKVPIFGCSLRALRCIPVSRGGVDTAATKAAVRLAQQGQLVGMFPEGRINATPELLLPGRPGAALVALRARVKIVPCYLHGTPYGGNHYNFLFLPAKATLIVGQPIDISEFFDREGDKSALETITLRLLEAIAALAGRHDYRPQLAGRNWKPGMEEVAE